MEIISNFITIPQAFILLAVIYILQKVYSLIINPWLVINRLSQLKGGYAYFYPVFGGLKLMSDNLAKKGDIIWSNQNLDSLAPNIQFTVSNIGTIVVVQLIDVSLLKLFFNADQSIYRKYRPFAVENFARVFGNGLAFSQGQDWKKQRNLLANAFNFEYMKKITPNIQESILKNIAEIEQISDNHLGGGFQIRNLQLTSQIACDVIVGSFFGNDPHNQSLNGKKLVEEINSLITQISLQGRSLTYLLFGSKLYQLNLTPYQRQLTRRIRGLKEFAKKIIERRIQESETDEKQNKGQKMKVQKDLMDYLLEGNMIAKENTRGSNQYSKQEIIDEFCTFLIAGTDTTSHLISMVIYYLSINKEIQEKLYQELQSVEEKDFNLETLKSFDYLFAVIKETQRVYGPAFSIFMRQAVVDHKIGEIPIQKGMCVSAGMIENGFNEAYFDDVHEFKPERWLSQQVIKDSFSFIPFAAGPRNCIGQHLAIYETQLTIAILVKRYEIQLLSDKKLRMVLNFMYEPETPVEVLLLRRNN